MTRWPQDVARERVADLGGALPEVLDERAVGELLGVRPSSVRDVRWRRRHGFRAHAIAGRVLVTRDELLRWIDRPPPAWRAIFGDDPPPFPSAPRRRDAAPGGPPPQLRSPPC